MLKTIIARRLQPADVDVYRTIRLSALQNEPDAFGSTYAIDFAKPIEEHHQRLTSSIVLGAFDREQIVGMIGLKVEDGPKDAHKAFVWGFYVAPASRSSGVGTDLMSALISAARGCVEQLTLSVVESQLAAIALYEHFGFVRYGVEPRALKSADGYANEVLMVLFLDAVAADEVRG